MKLKGIPLSNIKVMVSLRNKQIFFQKEGIILWELGYDLFIYIIKINCIQNLYCERFTPAFRPQNNLCEFTTPEHKIEVWFCTQNSVLKVRVKDGIQKLI